MGRESNEEKYQEVGNVYGVVLDTKNGNAVFTYWL